MVKDLQCRRPGFDPWVGKIPWRREWLPTTVFLFGEFHEQRSLVGYSPWGRKELDKTERLHFHFQDDFRLIKVWENCQISDFSLNVTLLAIKSLEAGKLCKHNDNVLLSRMNQYSKLNILPVHILQKIHTENLCEKCP